MGGAACLNRGITRSEVMVGMLIHDHHGEESSKYQMKLGGGQVVVVLILSLKLSLYTVCAAALSILHKYKDTVVLI